VLATMCDQLKGKANEIDSYGVTEDLKNWANAVVFASQRLDIKELETLAKMLKPVMEKVEYKEAINGSWNNEIVRENISPKEALEPQKWMKLIEIWREHDAQLHIKESVKKDIREYWYRNNIDYPYEIEGDGEYKPSPPSKSVPKADVSYPPPAASNPTGKSAKEEKKKDDSSEDDDDDEDIMNRLNKLKH
jgi:hypothetical protein